MKIFSGDSIFCDIGIPTGKVDQVGRELFTGDILLLLQIDNGNTEGVIYTPHGLTAVVAQQYQGYTDGTIKFLTDKPEPYIMGIRDCGFDSPRWAVRKVKDYSEVVSGEKWTEFKFRYGKSIPADFAKERAGHFK